MNRYLLSLAQRMCVAVIVGTVFGIPASAADLNGGVGGEPSHVEVNSSTQHQEVVSDEDGHIHVQVVRMPELGLTVVGVGKGGDPARDHENRMFSRGFEYCKLGTGHDSNYYITGERYVFGPNMNIYFGGHYTYLYADRWCGDGWYRPDGSIYYENRYHYHIPHPQDYGYEYWEWYNVVFSYDPMPTSMQDIEGVWTAKWWDEGNMVCLKNYTVMYNLSDHVMCGAVQSTDPYEPIDIRYDFTSDDDSCISWIRFDSYALNYTPDVKWRWYGPQGFYDEWEYEIPNPGAGNWWDWYKCWCYIYIRDHYPASHPGNWYVDIYVKNCNGNYEYKFSENFTITGPDIRIEPNSLAFTFDNLYGSDSRATSTETDSEVLSSILNGSSFLLTVDSTYGQMSRLSLAEFSLDAQSTTGPTPPPGCSMGHEFLPKERSIERLIPDVPTYLWHNGCGPTAAGMVIGYWDGRGFEELVPGNASNQTTAVNMMISSSGNYNDYCLPIDEPPNLLPDLSEPPFGDEHPDDCVADFMKTSQSYYSNYYGWSWYSHVDDAFQGYVQLIAPDYEVAVRNDTWGVFNWNSYCTEIDAGHPVVLLVDTDGNNETDHFVTGVGYRSVDDQQQYCCHNTWDTDLHWFDFEPMAGGQTWGIFGATIFSLSKPDAFAIHNDGAGTLSIDAIAKRDEETWLTGWYPDAPFVVNPASFQMVTVTVDPNLAEPGTNDERLFVYSNDPDENPYPDGVFITLTLSISEDTVYVHPDSSINTIQAGLDASTPYDIVLVGPGTYYENISWPNKPGVKLKSESGRYLTVIDGGDSVSITMSTSVASPTLIRGFTIRNGITDYNRGTRSTNSCIVCDSGASPRIDSCTISSGLADGVHCSNGASPIINYNDIINNVGYGVYNEDSSVIVNAENNWWGHSSGPGGAGPGMGDSVSNYVDYDPWLGDPIGVEEHESPLVSSPFVKINPNPFNETVNIQYSIGHGSRDIELRIFDVTGRLIKTFGHLPVQPMNQLLWRGDDNMGRKVSSGVYFLKFETDDQRVTEKLLLIR